MSNYLSIDFTLKRRNNSNVYRKESKYLYADRKPSLRINNGRCAALYERNQLQFHLHPVTIFITAKVISRSNVSR